MFTLNFDIKCAIENYIYGEGLAEAKDSIIVDKVVRSKGMGLLCAYVETPHALYEVEYQKNIRFDNENHSVTIVCTIKCANVVSDLTEIKKYFDRKNREKERKA